jgi:hypothetical protein
MLCTPNPVSSMRVQGGTRTTRVSDSPTRSSVADSTASPLENLLLGNAVAKAEREQGVQSKVVYEPSEEGEDSVLDTHVTLLRKQHIVENLQRAVQEFQREKDLLLLGSARRLAAQK